MTILDTNVVSELMKPEPSTPVITWISSQAFNDLFTTSITEAEVLYGVERLPKGKRRDELMRQAEATFAEDYAGRVLPFDENAAREFARIVAERRVRGRPVSFADAQIAAIARSHSAALATRNINDFEGCGLRLVNPWEG
jgi:predicted nucleic acid-binding protein